MIRSQPKAMPPCGGAPKVNASNRNPNFSCGFGRVQAHHREHAFLNVAAVDTNRAATDLVAVADDVVGVGQHVAGIAVDDVLEFGLGRGECVMHRGPRAASRRRHRRRRSRRRRARTAAGPPPRRTPRHRGSIRSSRSAISSRAAPSSARDDLAGPAEKKMQSPALRADMRGQAVAFGVAEDSWPPDHPACRRHRPARRPGPGGRAVWPTPASRPACAAAARPRRASPPHRHTAPGIPEMWCLEKNSVHSTSSSPNRRSGLSEPNRRIASA